MKTLIHGGHLIDPANRADARMDLMIEDGKVAGWYEPGDAGALRVAEDHLDAAGQIVCPGFLDMHMHEDPLDEAGQIRQCIFPAMLRMGVTSVLAGNCGDNVCHPLSYLKQVDAQGTAVNVAMLAGHTWFRGHAGLTDKYAPADETIIRAMREGMEEALEGGCAGLSYGLRYVPGMTTREFLETAGAAAPTRRLIAAHVRDDAAYVFAAVEELILAGERYHVPLQVSHIGSMGGFGQMEALLRRLDQAHGNGIDIAADCYPYDAFCTQIGASTYDEGWLERYHCGYDAVELCEGPYRGQRCTREIFEKMRREMPQALTVCYVMRPEEVSLALMHPNVCLGSDGILDEGQGHPRAAGAFPRFLHRYVGPGKLTLYEAIRKMSSFAARRIGLKDKGHLGVGADADLVLFDPERVCDRATFREPLLPPEGIDTVLIGGKVALQGGQITDLHCGRALYLERH